MVFEHLESGAVNPLRCAHPPAHRGLLPWAVQLQEALRRGLPVPAPLVPQEHCAHFLIQGLRLLGPATGSFLVEYAGPIKGFAKSSLCFSLNVGVLRKWFKSQVVGGPLRVKVLGV